MAFLRQTAHVCQIKDVLEGDYVKTEGWESNFVRTRRGDLSRVNIICAVVGKDEQGVLLDDGTGSIQGRAFDSQPFENVRVGDVVLVIGKVREFEDRYLVVELITPLDHDWVLHRKKLLDKFPVRDLSLQPATDIPAAAVNVNREDSVLHALKTLDKGEGVPIQALQSACEGIAVERVVEELLKEGEVFELRPGIIKPL